MAEEPNSITQSLSIRGPNQTSHYVDATSLQTRFADVIEAIIEAHGEVTVLVKREGLLSVLAFLRDEPSLQFNFLSDVAGVDLGEFAEPRFAVAYHVYSLPRNHRLRLKVLLAEDDAWLPTASDIWKSASWMEREIYDLFGIEFSDHPDLRRILMPADYEGHPLRKDFPVKGY